MKIGELRDYIKSHKKEQLEYLVAELYKLIPNDKKADYNIDEWIQHPPDKNEKKPKTKIVKTNKARDIQDIAKEVEFFCSNAYAQNYLAPNRSIPKKDRPKWRFVVKRLYNEIQAALDAGNHPVTCINELVKLYKVLTHACRWQIFSAFDPFESVGIDQSGFFGKIVTLNRNHKDLKDFISESIRLIIDNPLNRYTIHSELIDIYIEQCNTNDLLNLCFQQVGTIKKDVLQEPDEDSAMFSFRSNKDEMSYEKKEKINNLTEIAFTAKIKLFETDFAIQYLNEHLIETNPEVKLYILLSLLVKHDEKDHVVKIIENSKHLNPRQSITNLLEYIKTNDKLPKHF